MMDIKPYYPGFVRKAITFTIDDGNLDMDEKFLHYVRPAGIKGTFNLCSNNLGRMSAQAYRDFYEGYEIANHCKYHPFAFDDGTEYAVKDTPFDEATAAPAFLYPSREDPRLYMIHTVRGWRKIASTENYIRFMDEGKSELESVFGRGSISGFVWPFHPPKNEKVLRYAINADYESVRAVYHLGEGAARHFALPEDWKAWVYTAADTTLTAYSQEYAACPDDGTLKFFAVGVHSIDFEHSGSWDALDAFCRDFGHREDMYWYASNHEICQYAQAMQSLRAENGIPINESGVTLYLSVDGEKVTLPPKG